MISGTSVGKLFLAGLLPGVLIGLTQFSLTYGISKKNGWHPKYERMNGREMYKTAKDGLLAVLMPVFIVLSVSLGIATASESAAIAVLYALILGFFVYKELRTKDLLKALKKTAMMSSTIMIIGGFTMIFTWILAVEQVPNMIARFLLGSGISPLAVFIFLDVLILFVGTFLDVTPCILLLVPILLPVMKQFGMHELQFGAVLIVGLAIGLVTPPVGMCLNVANKICGLSIIEIFKAALPFIICNVIVLIVVTFVPAVSLWLPGLFG
jgi:tripartite ATP-independent transporter DctM subunit